MTKKKKKKVAIEKKNREKLCAQTHWCKHNPSKKLLYTNKNSLYYQINPYK